MSFIYCKDQRLEQRKRLSEVCFDDKVENLKEKISMLLGLPADGQEIVYHGTLLSNNRVLSSYDIQQGDTVHVLTKHLPSNTDAAKDVDINTVVNLLEGTIPLPSFYKLSVNRILEDADALEQLVSTTPGLRQDIIAMGLLRSPELVISLASTGDLRRVLEEHPCLALATSHIVKSNAATGTVPSLLRPQQQGRMMAQEELLAAREEALHMSGSGQQTTSVSASSSSSSPLTHVQSVSGGSASTATATVAPTTSVSSSTPSSSGRRQLITPGLFSQAIATAMSSTQAAAARNPQIENGVQQIRLMGIQASQEAIRRALIISDGNVEIAVNLLLEGDF